MVARSVERGNLGIAFFFDCPPMHGMCIVYIQMQVHTGVHPDTQA